VPVEAKPLFRPEALRPHLATFHLSERAKAARPKLLKWADLLSSGEADKYKEQEILHDFLTDVFCELLGYTRAVDNKERFSISREKHVQVDGKYADAVLGEFRNGTEQFTVALEGKGPKDPLDRPFAGRKMSAVDQGYRYAINLPCNWIIVTSVRQTRLYFKGADQHTYERFDTEKMVGDEGLLKRFVFLLGAERVVPSSGKCHFYDLLSASEKVGRELTKEFYIRYAEMRQSAFTHLRQANPDISPHEILNATQQLLDRILFCAFCERRGLLPPETIAGAYSHRDPYNPRPVWETFRGLFRSVNSGNSTLSIPAYNGGLFADAPVLDSLNVPDEVCGYFRDLAAYDFRPASQVVGEASAQASGKLIDVDILGHIFEQSISDLEKIRNELEGITKPLAQEQHTARRKKEGAFYTPNFITRYIVGEALGRVLTERFARLRQVHQANATGTARQALVDPNAYDVTKLNGPQESALIAFWQDWQEVLMSIRILDPACGSGAFLIEAFDQMYAAFQASNDRLEELRGQRTLFDLDKQILQHNLFGVDLNEEAVEICRLSLWIKTAQRGKPLTSLDHNIRVGNSVIADPAVHQKAFDWQAAFPEVFVQGCFDIVVGNPPYVRHKYLKRYKSYLKLTYEVYDGDADIYVYFYELGIRLLKPGGWMSFVVTNKWFKADYGEPLRGFLAKNTWIESVVDFGHAKNIFKDADVFPSIVLTRRPQEQSRSAKVRVCSIPRDQLRINDLREQIDREGADVERDRLGSEAWLLESKAVYDLRAKIRSEGVPLTEFSGVKPFRGIVTGFNDAFLIKSAIREALIAKDPRSSEVIKPYLKGENVDRWCAEWDGEWMIFARRGIDIERYPAILEHLTALKERLSPKPKDWDDDKHGEWKGRKTGSYRWYEIQDPIEYWQAFAKPKLFYQVIQYYPCYCLDLTGTLGNDKTAFIPSDDLYLLSVLNSPLMWWFNWRHLTHLKDEALSPLGYMMEVVPIARPSQEIRSKTEAAARRLIQIASNQHETRREMLDWLHIEQGVDEPSKRLKGFLDLDSDGFITEIRKLRGKKNPLSSAALRALREEFTQTVVPAQALASEARTLEITISDLVNTAYGLTPNDVKLIWETAPPRMPVSFQ
jgi:Eco57I restriction-modification methylase/Putative RNA methylase family UPF0020